MATYLCVLVILVLQFLELLSKEWKILWTIKSCESRVPNVSFHFVSWNTNFENLLCLLLSDYLLFSDVPFTRFRKLMSTFHVHLLGLSSQREYVNQS